MPLPESHFGLEHQHADVLTLPEAASYLRVTEEALSELIEDDAIPAQKIGQEWRFLKRALNVWLGSGRRYYREMHSFPPWILDSPFVDELAHLILQRIRSELAAECHPSPKPGSKAAVLQSVGMWRDDPWVKSKVAEMYGGEDPATTEGKE
jgi:excisionase family DNA binding protein